MVVKQTLPTSMRLAPDIKAALERAAKADDRSVSSMVERILKGWLLEHGHLPPPDDHAPTAGQTRKPRK